MKSTISAPAILAINTVALTATFTDALKLWLQITLLLSSIALTLHKLFWRIKRQESRPLKPSSKDALLIVMLLSVARLGVLLAVLVSFTGCTALTSVTYDPTSGKATTRARCISFFDSHSALARFSNRSEAATNGVWAPGTYIAGLDQSTSSTNLAGIFEAVARGAVQGAK